MKKTILLLFLLFLFYPIIGSATTVEGLTSTVGYADMDGMKVTVTFGNNTYETQTWATSSSISDTSGVYGTGWSLTFSGDDTYPMPSADAWNFESSNSLGIYSVMIEALPGNSVFDIIGHTGSDYRTQGSAFGWWGTNNWTGTTSSGTNSFGSITADWAFSDLVQVGSNTIEDDVYTTLLMNNFTLPQGQTTKDLAFNFYLDTDHVVPEPATLLLFGIGLLGISAVSRKKQAA